MDTPTQAVCGCDEDGDRDERGDPEPRHLPVANGRDQGDGEDAPPDREQPTRGDAGEPGTGDDRSDRAEDDEQRGDDQHVHDPRGDRDGGSDQRERDERCGRGNLRDRWGETSHDCLIALMTSPRFVCLSAVDATWLPVMTGAPNTLKSAQKARLSASDHLL